MSKDERKTFLRKDIFGSSRRLAECIIPHDEWIKNPDTGIPALLERYREERGGFMQACEQADAPPEPVRKYRKRTIYKIWDKDHDYIIDESKLAEDEPPVATSINKKTGEIWKDSLHYKQCHTCLRIKPRAEFYPKGNAYDGLHYECRSCSMERYARNKKRRQGQE